MLPVSRAWKEALVASLILLLLSWTQVRLGIAAGEAYIPAGQGAPKPGDGTPDLFRFDSFLYKSIAEDGYSYHDPSTSPNIVFAPLFPLTVAALPFLHTETAGFVLNKIFLLAALTLLFQLLRQSFTPTRTFLTLFAMMTSAGSYSFHAFYSESVFLLSLAITLYGFQKRNWWLTGLGAALLGAARLTGLPIAAVFAALLLWQAFRARSKERDVLFLSAVLAVTGGAAYLGYLALQFGNPFTLLPEIQTQSWGSFHPPTEWWRLLTGNYIALYIGIAASKGFATFYDILTLNLIWTLLGLGSAIYVARAWRRHAFTYAFVPYALFIYITNTSSPFLISAHRFFVIMLPIFLMMGAGIAAVERKAGRIPAAIATAVFLILNIAYGLLHTAAFNQGIWYWF